MCDQNTVSDKFQKLRKHDFNAVCIHNHRVIDRSKLGNAIRNGNSRIHKKIHAVHDFSVFQFYRTDFDDMVFLWIKAGRLQVKNHGTAG